MKNIAIIGAGELGSRHLQSFALHEGELSIYVVDPFEESLQRSKERFCEVDCLKNKQVIYTNSIANLPNKIDFVVISTNSLQRLSVLKELLDTSKVQYLILEKFLFPLLEEYTEAEKLIAEKNVKVFVNCSRRMWPDYQKLKREFKVNSNIKLTVDGVNWNLSSNAIHFLDLFFYLTEDKEIEIDTKELDINILENKRPGYIDFTGTLKGCTANGNQILLTSSKRGNGILKIIIESNEQVYEIKEWAGEIKYNNKEKPFKTFYTSELTHKIFEQLIDIGTCHLVDFQTSVQHHLFLLNAFNEFLGEREGAIT